MTGRVFAHAGQAFEPRAYDFAVVGGGRMGLAAAFYLQKFAPNASVLIVEREGIPSEGGATSVARGVWTSRDLPDAWRNRAAWTRSVWLDPSAETDTRRPHDPPFRLVGLAEFTNGFEFDELGGHGSATTLALAYGYGAVRLGADLLLNTEARLTEAGLELHRLDITNTMEIVVAQVARVETETTIVAAGSEGPSLLERDLGIVTAHGRAFTQFPRLEARLPEGFPVVRAGGFTFRSEAGGLRVLPPLRGPDPAGYVPVGGRLVGVPVGVRREVLDDLLAVLDDLPFLGSERLNLGKTVGDVPGAWEARPRGGWPLWERVSPSARLLLGGPEADRAGPAVALDLAATLAGVSDRPW